MLNIFMEEKINKILIVIFWITVICEIFNNLINSTPDIAMYILKSCTIFILPTILIITKKLMKFIKYIVIFSLIFFLTVVFFNSGVLMSYDTAYYFLIALAATSVYFDIHLTLSTLAVILIDLVSHYLINKTLYFTTFTLSNFVTLIISMIIITSIIAIQVVMSRKLMNANFKLYESAVHDHLTEAYNRAFYENHLEECINRAFFEKS